MEGERERRRGFAEALPRAVLRRTGERFVDATGAVLAAIGIVTSVVGVLSLALYLDMSAAELGALLAIAIASYSVDGLLAARVLRRDGAPIAAHLRGEGAPEQACDAAARLPMRVVRHRPLYAVAAVAALTFDVAATLLLDLPPWATALLLPGSFGAYLYWCVLRALALELGMRPILEQLRAREHAAQRISLRWRLLATLPAMNWGTGVTVGGTVSGGGGSELERYALAVVVALAVTLGVSIWLTLLLADAVSGPIVDLRDATRAVKEGDFDVRVPVVSTDETGELAAAFNDMVGGLRERERLRDAFGAFVDPTLTERVLAEGTDLRGEELVLSILFLDVRGFTTFAESARADEVVGRLNALYEEVVPIILRHGGHANKFIGDGLLAVFGAPERLDDHADRAVAAAIEIARTVNADDRHPLRVGIGVNTGPALVGTIGGGGRLDFTVIGDTVNTAARVESATRATGDDVLITEATLRALAGGGDGFVAREPVAMKGKSREVRLFAPSRRPVAADG
ncbi:MAG TPA: adenylate/guanylate cyclase domain-containing protein [Solirubrobacteraceae bacterium]|nr:adenylate/guanylate cyclase domain-containing protein [Solirubrobacteraceae bacterium]